MIKKLGFQRDKHFTLRQFCNDWISADDEAGKQHILNPTSMELESIDELELFLNDPNPGLFWSYYMLDGLRFKKKA